MRVGILERAPLAPKLRAQVKAYFSSQLLTALLVLPPTRTMYPRVASLTILLLASND